MAAGPMSARLMAAAPGPPTSPAPSPARPKASPADPLGEREAHDDFAVLVDITGRHEPEPLVEPGRAAGQRDVAGQQLGRAFGAHELHDLPNDLGAVPAALVPLVDEQLPQEPRPDDHRRIRL